MTTRGSGSLVCPRCLRRSGGEVGGASRLGFATCAEHDAVLVPASSIERGAGDPLLGALLEGRFAVFGARAFGASAAIYDVIDRRVGDACVAKVLRSDGPAGDLSDACARHEAAILSCLPVDAGVSLRAVGTVELRPGTMDPAISIVRAAFLVTDVARGSPLTERLGSLEHARAGHLLATLLATLEATHAVGVAHGDLKPAHVFVDASDAVASLVDFGSSVADGTTGPRRRPPQPSASPAYAAPEGYASAAGDLFAAARTCRACMVSPLRAALDAACREGPTKGPGGLLTTLARCLAADPEQRPRTACDARAMLVDLEGFSARTTAESKVYQPG